MSTQRFRIVHEAIFTFTFPLLFIITIYFPKGDDPLTLLNSVKQLVDNGLSIVPVEHGQKRPACDWKAYQKRKPQFNELAGWFGWNSNMGYGVVCGEVSGNLVCLDLD